ncbi:hypothetical protein [Limnoraphis robusta]|uniref:Uncharacterized protein n=1 Tax=Limnoraphis robusta CCNP1315 TaxID=3110306 RepID=A0ABU5TTC3_9CYAN|nr:hypothetical protein [Limnoraphis robusta]MEA5518146.1 hypothetical protein [Limnoraphis robusta CCNP1315]MEA5543410.1 hypothetical protein [Limnoraphis robusta CCNP1324]
MDNKVGFLLKVLLLSAAISVFIKYVGPYLSIPLSVTNTLIAVFFPSIAIALIFLWRGTRSYSQQ